MDDINNWLDETEKRIDKALKVSNKNGLVGDVEKQSYFDRLNKIHKIIYYYKNNNIAYVLCGLMITIKNNLNIHFSKCMSLSGCSTELKLRYNKIRNDLYSINKFYNYLYNKYNINNIEERYNTSKTILNKINTIKDLNIFDHDILKLEEDVSTKCRNITNDKYKYYEIIKRLSTKSIIPSEDLSKILNADIKSTDQYIDVLSMFHAIYSEMTTNTFKEFFKLEIYMDGSSLTVKDYGLI